MQEAYKQFLEEHKNLKDSPPLKEAFEAGYEAGSKSGASEVPSDLNR